MKFLIACTFAALCCVALANTVQLSDEQKAKVKQYAVDCIKQENLSEDETKKLHNRDFVDPSNNLKCFANCFFEKCGAIKDGVVQEDVILEKLGALIGEEKTKTAIAKCNGFKGADKCDTAFKLYECYENAKAEFNISIQPVH